MAPWLLAIGSVAAVAVAIYVKVFLARDNNTNERQDDNADTAASAAHHLYVIGDLHGDVDCARHWVSRVGLEQWGNVSHDKNHLVFLGDYVDKGIQSKQTVEYVKSLTEAYPHHVTALMGNHELELLRDRSHTLWAGGTAGYYQLPYASVHPGEYLNYLPRVDANDLIAVEALYNASLEVYGYGLHSRVYLIPDSPPLLELIPESLRDLVSERLRTYQTAYLNAYRSGTALGDWLERRPAVAVVHDTVLTHGGLAPRVAPLLVTRDQIDDVNAALAAHAARDAVGLDAFLRGTPIGEAVYSLLTYRGNHKDGACEILPGLLPQNVRRLAVGHTPASKVRVRCPGDTFLALDSALSRWFRNSGNDYCPGHVQQVSSNGMYVCRRKNEQCQGQVVRIAPGGNPGSVHVMH